MRVVPGSNPGAPTLSRKHSPKPLVVIPTYNERANIQRLVPEILRALPRGHVLVVDDASPDFTASAVHGLMHRYRGRVHILQRPFKAGLGSAYLRGFRFARKYRYDPIIQMDADGSHDPAVLPRMVRRLSGMDAVVGSRYLGVAGVRNWPWSRILLSILANGYARLITGTPLTDLTGGYNAWRRDQLTAVRLRNIRCNGYAFQIELKHRCWRQGGRISEMPIVFTGRREGESKLSRSVVLEAIVEVWRMRLERAPGGGGGGRTIRERHGV